MGLLAMLIFMGLIFGSEIKVGDTETVVKIEEDDYLKAKRAKSSNYFGVSYSKQKSTFCVQRRSKQLKKLVCNGYYKDERKAAQASDTLARKLMRDGEEGHQFNFPDDHTEVHSEVRVTSSKYIGVFYDKRSSVFIARRWSCKKKNVSNGTYKDETKAAQASDTLARKLMRDGEKGHQLNFPDDDTEVYSRCKVSSSQYIGVLKYNGKARWYAQRWSKKHKKEFFNGCYRYEREAALASDTLARAFMRDGEKKYKLNFTDEEYYQIHWKTNHKIDEKEGIYSKRKRYNSGNSGSQQEYLVYKME